MNLNKVCGKFNPLREKPGNKMFNMELKNFKNCTKNSYNFFNSCRGYYQNILYYIIFVAKVKKSKTIQSIEITASKLFMVLRVSHLDLIKNY